MLNINTPLLESLPLSNINATKVWLKMDALQPSGSFKIRGIGYACEYHHAKGARRFISSSGGNAGLAVAYAGKKLNVPVTVVVPETTSQRAVQLLKLEGAEVIIHGKIWSEANKRALSLVTDSDAFLHPFDDPLLWHGHASMIDEVVSAGIKPDAIVLSVGGGGLLSGVVEGLIRNNLNDVDIYAVETEGMSSYFTSIQAGQLTEMPMMTGVATSLGAPKVCQRALDIAKEHCVTPIKVTDQEAVTACLSFLDDNRVLVEPACGASLAVLYGKKMLMNHYQNVLVIVCGGSTSTIDSLKKFQYDQKK